MVGRHQEVSLAAMEGRFHSGARAEISMIGQPNVRERKLENPIAIPGILSYLVNGSFNSNVRGLEEMPRGVHRRPLRLRGAKPLWEALQRASLRSNGVRPETAAARTRGKAFPLSLVILLLSVS